jgi:hypothetical protein
VRKFPRFVAVLLLSASGYCAHAQDQAAQNESTVLPKTEKIDFPLPRSPSALVKISGPVSPTISVVESHPIKRVRAPKKPFLVLSGLTYAALGYDMAQTESEKQRWNRSVNRGLQTCPNCVSEGIFKWYSDGNPLARPVVNLPEPAYFATGIAIATGVNWLAWRMGRSRRFHKAWFVPQLISIGANTWGGSTYRH